MAAPASSTSTDTRSSLSCHRSSGRPVPKNITGTSRLRASNSAGPLARLGAAIEGKRGDLETIQSFSDQGEMAYELTEDEDAVAPGKQICKQLEQRP